MDFQANLPCKCVASNSGTACPFLSNTCVAPSALLLQEVDFDVDGVPNTRRFNKHLIAPGYQRHWYPTVPADIDEAAEAADERYHLRTVDSSFFANRNATIAQTRRKLVPAIILSISPPANNGSASGYHILSKSGAALNRQEGKNGSVRARTPFFKMLFLGNLHRSSQDPFAVLLPSKNELMKKCCNNSLANLLTVGDVIGIIGPKISTDYLGTTHSQIQIIKSWKYFVLMRQNVVLPTIPLRMAAEGHNMVYFIQPGCDVALGNCQILFGQDVPCAGTTCDRQTTSCKGCSPPRIRKNYVLQVDVEVNGQHEYNSETGRATFTFRSWRFTEFVIHNFPAFSRLDPAVMLQHTEAIDDALDRLCVLINANNGWTVIGWHKRGVLDRSNDSGGQPELASDTEGHLVKLVPTNFPQDQEPALRLAQFTYQP